MIVERGRPLAPLTTLGLGGPAARFVTAESDAALVEALRYARAEGLEVTILGGGSNVVIADAGLPGLVVAVAQRGLSFGRASDKVRLRAAAGEPWDGVVAAAVARGLGGVECLAGIPGLAGATPIQNVGAYGQEVSDTLEWVRLLDRASLTERLVPAAELGLAYRDSALKREPGRYVVLEIALLLEPDAAPTIRYGELSAAVGAEASLAEVRETVIALRRRKSMVVDPLDPNSRSAGSFFTNPIVDATDADRVVSLAIARGIVAAASEVPRYPAEGGRVKLAAGWLIERAGVAKGYRRGAVGVSSAHALSLVHHGGGSTAALLALADEVSGRVYEAFGVALEREPVLLT